MDDEKKSAADLQREQIQVTLNTPLEDETSDDKEQDTSNDDKKEVKEEEKKEEIEVKEKTAEELEAEKAAAKTTRERDRVQKRIDKITAEKAALLKELEEVKAKLEAKAKEGEVVLTEDDIKKEAERIANEKIALKEFNQACDRIADAGVKADKDFNKKVKEMADDIGPIPSQMIGMLDDLDNGGEVLSYLTNNVDEAEEIYSLPMGKMASRLAKISTKLIKPPKQVSKVPAPNEPVNANNKNNETVLSDKDDMDTWVRKRNKQVMEREAARRGGMR